MSKKIITIITSLIVIVLGYSIYKYIDARLFLKDLKGEIVYAKRDNGIMNIYKISANGQNKKLLYHNEDSINSNSAFPRWSADGKEIYFSAMKNGEWKTYVMDSDGNNVRLSDQANETTRYPSRETDIIGEQGNLYYYEGDKKIKVFSFSNYNIDGNPGASEASWSPDRKYIIFELWHFIGGNNIMIVNREGTKVVKLTSGMEPDWK